MIHEMVHAYLNVKYSQPLDFDNGMDFLLKMDRFALDNGIPNVQSNKFHHEFMGQYIYVMAVSLLSWDVKCGTGGIMTKDSSGKEMRDWDYYRSMAFGGLSFAKMDASGKYILDSDGNRIYEDTDSFKELVPKEEDQDKIKNILKNEQTGNSKSKESKC